MNSCTNSIFIAHNSSFGIHYFALGSIPVLDHNFLLGHRTTILSGLFVLYLEDRQKDIRYHKEPMNLDA